MKDRKLSAEMRGFRFFVSPGKAPVCASSAKIKFFSGIGLRDKVNPRKNLIFGREEQEKDGAFAEM